MSNKERREFQEMPSLFPLAPFLLSVANRSKVEALRNAERRKNSLYLAEWEKTSFAERCHKRQELCHYLSKIDRENPIWRYGEDFFATLPYGKRAV